ncbi:p25-alpha family protein [Loa loa]|uniref:p25-alpha family protein n=1 Tax=Loa loa TaxID=7209 RepID=A0A1S0TTP4_LOALO|nr:p25-alpha family protein [Loa loa]EFO20038.2 p25-alpha family protein [Loa loa]
MAEKQEYKFKWDGKEIKHRWEGFVKFGNASAVEMTGKNFDKWLKDGGIQKKANFNETKDVLVAVAEDRARTTKKDPQEELDIITEKLSKLEAPSLKGVAKASADGVYNRLTDHTKYTGSHKERFDAEGKGRGKLGREDIVEQTGYVAAYKNKDTYDKLHKNIQ